MFSSNYCAYSRDLTVFRLGKYLFYLIDLINIWSALTKGNISFTFKIKTLLECPQIRSFYSSYILLSKSHDFRNCYIRANDLIMYKFCSNTMAKPNGIITEYLRNVATWASIVILMFVSIPTCRILCNEFENLSDIARGLFIIFYEYFNAK